MTVERGFDIPNTVGVVASDLNNDRAIDLVLTGEKTTILLNPREGAFKTLDAFGATAPADTRGVVAFDFDKDGWMDLAFTSGAAPALTVWRNVKGQSFERVDLPASTLTEGFGLTAIDYDNDGWLDLVAAGAGPKGGVLQALAQRPGPIRGRLRARRHDGGVSEATARGVRRRPRRRQRRRSHRHRCGRGRRSVCETTAATPATRFGWR